MKNTRTEVAFEKIAEEAIREAEAVRCPFSAFAEGMKTIAQMCKERADLAAEESRAHEED
jgi:hypothetical protein